MLLLVHFAAGGRSGGFCGLLEPAGCSVHFACVSQRTHVCMPWALRQQLSGHMFPASSTPPGDASVLSKRWDRRVRPPAVWRCPGGSVSVLMLVVDCSFHRSGGRPWHLSVPLSVVLPGTAAGLPDAGVQGEVVGPYRSEPGPARQRGFLDSNQASVGMYVSLTSLSVLFYYYLKSSF